MVELEFPDNVTKIWSQDRRRVIGTGFLVGSYLVTCAHVIRSAAPSPAIGDKVPFSTQSGETSDAELVAIGDGARRSGDWAVAALLSSDDLGGTLLLQPEFSPGHPYLSFGFAQDWTDFGAHAEGICGNVNASGLVELLGSAQGFRIGPGFSGAPVIDKITGGAVGHIVGNDASGASNIAFMLPIKRPLSAVPALEGLCHPGSFTRPDVQRMAELGDEPSVRGKAVRYIVGSVLPSSTHDPTSRYWAYLALGYLGGDIAKNAVNAAWQNEENGYARGGLEEALDLLGR